MARPFGNSKGEESEPIFLRIHLIPYEWVFAPESLSLGLHQQVTSHSPIPPLNGNLPPRMHAPAAEPTRTG